MKRSELDMSRGSLNRVWLILGVFAKYEGEITSAFIGKKTEMQPKSVVDTLGRINGFIPGLVLTRSANKKYQITEWGFLLDKENFQCFQEMIEDGDATPS
jgi:hypothetical protein